MYTYTNFIGLGSFEVHMEENRIIIVRLWTTFSLIRWLTEIFYKHEWRFGHRIFHLIIICDQFAGDHGGKSILHFEFEITIVCNGSMFNSLKIHIPRNRIILHYYYYLTLPSWGKPPITSSLCYYIYPVSFVFRWSPLTSPRFGNVCGFLIHLWAGNSSNYLQFCNLLFKTQIASEIWF